MFLFNNADPRYRLFAKLSFLCPIIAALFAWLSISGHDQFWAEVTSNLSDDANRNAGAMMAAAEAIQVLFFVVAGTIVGLVFAIVSLAIQRAKLGYYALAFNLFPYLVLILVKV